MGLSMLIIYGLMAMPFRSYWQPVLILTAIPFGIMGAIFGHVIMGHRSVCSPCWASWPAPAWW